jgi:hypothetical protein
MKHKKYLQIIVLTLTSFVIFNACNKSDSVDQSPIDETEIVQELFVEGTYDDLQEMTEEAFYIGSGALKSINSDFLRFGNCITITLDTTVMPRVITLDFGDENCLCRDGKYRRGQIISTFNGRFRQPGTIITYAFNDYYVNDNHVEGTKQIENKGFNDENQMWYEINVQGTITFVEDSTIVSWTAEKTRTWINGLDTPQWRDDVFLIDGAGEFVNSAGYGKSVVITEPLKRELSCPFFVSGIVETTPTERPKRILDYGNGECDRFATVTIGDRTFIIRLR